MNLTAASVFNPCILIPVYNHAAVVENTVKLLVARDLSIVMVDDGSEPQHRAILQRLASDYAQVHLVTHARNRGKGAAVKTGLREAHKLKFSHALQVDADGQHDLGDIDRFLETARAHPGALVAGHPVYDDSVPRLRFYSRYLSHVLVWLNTLSFTIIDSMCGFRVYPLPRSDASCAGTGPGIRWCNCPRGWCTRWAEPRTSATCATTC
jgi:glycosyltransferase involved in cell wall biosynthesis